MTTAHGTEDNGLGVSPAVREREQDPDVAVLTWDPVCQRSVSLAQRLREPLETIHYLGYRRPWMAPIKYPLQAATTWEWLQRRRPAAVMVSNPPPFAAGVVWAYCAPRNIPFIIDAHTGVFPKPSGSASARSIDFSCSAPCSPSSPTRD